MIHYYRKKTLKLLIILLIIFTIVFCASLLDFIFGFGLLNMGLMNPKIEDTIIFVMAVLCLAKVCHEIMEIEGYKEYNNRLKRI